MKKLKKKLEKAATAYVDLFCKKHDTDLEYWVDNVSFNMCVIGDNFFNLSDIILDLEFNCHGDLIWDWYNYNLESYEKDASDYRINYRNWIKGVRPSKDENKNS